MASKGKLYVVTMYRWGDREDHSYLLGVYSKKHRAVEEGSKETGWRGGKYFPEVIETEADPHSAHTDGAMTHLKTIVELPANHALSGLPMLEHYQRKWSREGNGE